MECCTYIQGRFYGNATAMRVDDIIADSEAQSRTILFVCNDTLVSIGGTDIYVKKIENLYEQHKITKMLIFDKFFIHFSRAHRNKWTL